ncbi:transcriptional regulator, TetR family [Ruminococcus flavefaciens]|uniref:Transcriptional regulator, TetR family n=1 Tax=Ruminococcus flavefaciens TaxID=1265 RepID=A0A1H6L7J8_RUMFL|nr:TetR/AcrR family transcriptional regulator [Ruminococcus flavefaciens]SEH84162.1 transcriptional regulator, TetR family [Ruminococcus flavefaciens]
MQNTAKPVQARSQKTKENLLKAALSMYEKKGYHKTTVDDIAAEAGVSTGIAYRYFRNKKDILLSVISYGADNIENIAELGNTKIPDEITDIRQYLEVILKSFEAFHKRYHDIHVELEGLLHTDEDVRILYSEITGEKMKIVTSRLLVFMNDDTYIREKAYSAIGIMEQHCHMMMNNELYGLDTDVMRNIVINAVLSVLK